jgi:CubicO group peptidase (beta-lactamase class C family)
MIGPLANSGFGDRIASGRTRVALLLVATSWNLLAMENEKVPQSIPELRVAIEAVLKETKTPGAAIAIVSSDSEEWVAGIGLAEVAANQPVTSGTLFRIGSVSKGFAALAALKLQEEGELKLSDTVRQWTPEVAFDNPWEESDPVRLVHLMEHTSGFDDIHFREYAHNDSTPISLPDALAFGAASRRCRWRPGSRMSYCNSGPAVLAAVIEKVSKRRFEDYVQEHFFNPLHMDTASYFLTPEVEQHLTKLYHSDGITCYPYWHIAYRAAGSVNASAKDMAKYVRFYLQRGSFDGTQLLGAASIERMETTETLPAAKLGSFAGYGLYNHAICEGPFVFRGHGGGLSGGLTYMAYLPEHGRGYAAMINSGDGKAMLEIAKLIRRYLVRDLVSPILPRVASVPIEPRQRYAGYYEGISPRHQRLNGFGRLLQVRKLTFSGDGLFTTTYGFGLERWLPVSERLFRKEDQSVASLALLPDGDGETLIQYRWETLKKASAFRIWAQAAGAALISLLVLSSVLFAPVWIFRTLRGKLRNAGPLSMRVMPLVGSVLLVAFDFLIAVGFRGLITGRSVDDLLILGAPSLLTVSIWLTSMAFAAAVASSLYVVHRHRRTAMSRWVYWHSAAVATALLGVAIYYGYWGLLGLRLWA